MANIKFISGDGVEHEVEETSPAAAHMIKEGFQRLDAPKETTEAAPVKKDLSKMTKAELVAEAERIGVVVVPDELTKAQIIELIEAGPVEPEA